ncbi:Rossman fold protein, TIGR00730 family [Paenibacillus oryzae]|uniref:Rossman fold protein, TIGR00730 family n=1 Tax=Paenibacillus oryzae TaxID=1844972 RepID=A0A1A5YIU7_9BACL|nr:LOG family protein [Paenibacillus oryzae]OBR65522.1 Rossman fold protein, TIGR00730 family [Paenibacillus oryzae]
MNNIAVFCGSSEGLSPVYKESAIALGTELGKRGLTLVYGGANVGLMGAVADAVLNAGGKAIGILPRLHERKARMAELADAFIAMPGGPGTLEEYFEIFTWGQLGLHTKPSGLLNVNHYFDSLIDMFNTVEREGFMASKYRSMVLADTTASGLLEQFAAYTPPGIKTYLTEQRT